MNNKDLQKKVFSIKTHQEFESICMEVFRKQAKELYVYQKFLEYLHIDSQAIKRIEEIPFLPIEFFKNHTLFWPEKHAPEIVFSSSGTTGSITSQHHVMDVSWYQESFLKAFQTFYGNPEEWTILALLPSYQEREGSSLIYMVNNLLQTSINNHPESGYFLHEPKRLYEQLLKLRKQRKKTLLIGVTYALLDFVEAFKIDFPELIVMETGGMKGRRKEMIREEVHDLLKKGFGISQVHSEYGMTELLSQGYSLGNGIFTSPPWMKISIRDIHDHFHILPAGKTGGINIIDLANYHSCSFLATQDLGKWHESSSASKNQVIHFQPEFEVLGRFDHSDIRGCNLLVD